MRVEAVSQSLDLRRARGPKLSVACRKWLSKSSVGGQEARLSLTTPVGGCKEVQSRLLPILKSMGQLVAANLIAINFIE